MKKISYNDFVKSMTVFFVDEKIDEKYQNLRNDKVQLLRDQMKNIGSREGLEKYLRNHKDSLENILVVLGVSVELFKRIISMFRIQRGLKFQTEWDLNKTRNFILEDNYMLNKVCDLFLEGNLNSNLRENIPGFKLSNFVISEQVQERLHSEDFLKFLVNKDFDTSYNAELSSLNIRKIDETLNQICSEKQNFRLEKNPKVDPVGNGTRDILVNYAIYKEEPNPLFFIKFSFNITTSKGQTDFKRSVKDLRDYIKNKNSEAKQIVIVDGAGWIARQSDLKDVWDYSHFCINLNHINDLFEIVK